MTATDASNGPMVKPGSEHPSPDLIDATHQEQIISRLEERGVDDPPGQGRPEEWRYSGGEGIA